MENNPVVNHCTKLIDDNYVSIGILQVAKWALLVISIPTVVLIPVGLIIFFACDSKQKKMIAKIKFYQRTVAKQELAMEESRI